MAKREVDPRLIGTWQSDRRRTFRHFRPRPGCPPSSFRKLKNLFGKLVITWDRKTFTTLLDGEEGTGKYEVVARDDDSVVIRSDCPLSGTAKLQQINFCDNYYWIALGSLTEWFRRID